MFRVGGIGSYTDVSSSTSATGASVPRDYLFSGGVPLTFTGLPGPTTHAKSRTNGVGGGATLSASRGGWFMDGLAKLDFLEVSRLTTSTDAFGTARASVRVIDAKVEIFDQNGRSLGSGNGRGCIVANGGVEPKSDAERVAAIAKAVTFAASAPVTTTETATLALFTLASNLGRTVDLHNGFTFDPSVGFRYTHASYFNTSANAAFRDADSLRLEAGAKLSHSRPVGGNAVWINAVGFYLYSDVWVTGAVSSSEGTTFQGDEGQIRARGMLQSKMQFNNGVQLYGEVNGRVGRDYQAVGGKLGARIEW